MLCGNIKRAWKIIDDRSIRKTGVGNMYYVWLGLPYIVLGFVLGAIAEIMRAN